jgi:hypothetical protein
MRFAELVRRLFVPLIRFRVGQALEAYLGGPDRVITDGAVFLLLHVPEFVPAEFVQGEFVRQTGVSRICAERNQCGDDRACGRQFDRFDDRFVGGFHFCFLLQWDIWRTARSERLRFPL